MTPKQTKTLEYAGFTEAQITALSTVFNVLPAPERRAEIDGFVRETCANLRAFSDRLELARLEAEALTDRAREIAEAVVKEHQAAGFMSFLPSHMARVIEPFLEPKPPTP